MKPRILVIDDEAAIRDSLRMILEYEDYQFVGAASGQEGLAIAQRERPDLVLLDIKMPGILMSRKTRSGASRSISLMPSSPVAACSTS